MTGFVYYCDDGRDRIKIGYSLNPRSRLREFKTVNPEIELVLIERYRGIDGRELEQKRHEQFQDDRIAGEWFHRSQRLDEWIGFHQALLKVRWSVQHQWAWASVYPRDAQVVFNIYNEGGTWAGDIDNPPKEWLKSTPQS